MYVSSAPTGLRDLEEESQFSETEQSTKQGSLIMRKILVMSVLALSLAGLVGCNRPLTRGEKGALIGSTAGAVVGGIAGGGTGAAIGAVGGAAVGGIIGKTTGKK